MIYSLSLILFLNRYEFFVNFGFFIFCKKFYYILLSEICRCPLIVLIALIYGLTFLCEISFRVELFLLI